MASKTSLTLLYFDFAGPAEPVRMALAMTGQPWEDKRLTHDEFLALKPGRVLLLLFTIITITTVVATTTVVTLVSITTTVVLIFFCCCALSSSGGAVLP